MDKALPIISRANPRLLASRTYFVAITDDGDVIGSGGWSREQPGARKIERGIGHIRHFATHPDWTHSGVGRAIHERCADEGKAVGLDCFECYASLNAVDFYTKLGFDAVRPMDVVLNDQVVLPVMLMEQAL
jgi:N-acetylglutamate synthase-like GNAT family acetyltransferase